MKAKGIAKDIFGTYENYVLPVQTLSNKDDLINAFEWMKNNEDEIRNHLNDFMPSYKERALQGRAEIEKLLVSSMKINELKAGAILSYVQLILGNIISIIYTPIMLRLLGQNEYGLYNLSSSTISYLGLLSFGFGSAYIRYYSKYKAKKDEASISRLNGTFLIVYSVIAVVALIAGIVLSNIELIFENGLMPIEFINLEYL